MSLCPHALVTPVVTPVLWRPAPRRPQAGSCHRRVRSRARCGLARSRRGSDMPRRCGRAARSAVITVAAAAGLALVTAAPGTAAQARQAPAAAARAAGAPATGRISWAGAQRQADGLVSQLTLDEKVSLVHGDTFGPPGFAGHVPGITRVVIPGHYLYTDTNRCGH